ncbi:MAG TPA: CBS domain-containing protein [Kofleriaceae bacterium]
MLSSAAVTSYRASPWNDPDDEPTLVLHTLGSVELSPCAIVEESTPLSELRDLLIQLRVPALAVVDDEKNLSGLVTRTDVLGAESEMVLAGEIMSGFVFALTVTATIHQAAALMAHECVGQILVTTSSGELVGMLSSLDVARYVAVHAGYLDS